MIVILIGWFNLVFFWDASDTLFIDTMVIAMNFLQWLNNFYANSVLVQTNNQ